MSADPRGGFVEAVGHIPIVLRLDRITEQLEAIRGELAANEREHVELVSRHNLLCDEYDRLMRKADLIEGGGDTYLDLGDPA